MNSVAMLTCAAMGGYKSYSRGPSFALDVWLPEKKGVLYTTIPLNVGKIAEVARKRFKISEEETFRRLQVIPQDLVSSWIADGSVKGPWEADWDFAGAHLQFDEFHNYCPRTGEVDRRKKWADWLAEIRHEGATIEFITQDVERVDKRLLSLVALRYELVNQETSREPFFGCSMGDWYELKSKLVGYWAPCVWEIEKRRVDRRYVNTGHLRRIYPSPLYYGLYNSWNTPHRKLKDVSQGEEPEGEEVDEKPVNPNPRQFEQRSWPGLLWWFFRRNGGSLLFRLALAAVVCWVCFGGGGKVLMQFWLARFAQIQKANAISPDSSPTANPVNSGAVAVAPPDQAQIEIVDVETTGVMHPVVVRTRFDGEGERQYTDEDLPQLLTEKQLLYADVARLESERAQLIGDAEKLVMIGVGRDGRAYALFESGFVAYAGERLRVPGYEGRQVLEVSQQGGYCSFIDGGRLYVCGVSTRRNSIGGGSPTVARPIQTGSSVGTPRFERSAAPES